MLKWKISETFFHWSLPQKCCEIYRTTCPWINSLQYWLRQPCLVKSFLLCFVRAKGTMSSSFSLSINKKNMRLHVQSHVLMTAWHMPSRISRARIPARKCANTSLRFKKKKDSLTYRWQNLQKKIHYMVNIIVIPTLRRFLNSSAINLHRKARSSPEPPSLSSSSS